MAGETTYVTLNPLPPTDSGSFVPTLNTSPAPSLNTGSGPQLDTGDLVVAVQPIVDAVNYLLANQGVGGNFGKDRSICS